MTNFKEPNNVDDLNNLSFDLVNNIGYGNSKYMELFLVEFDTGYLIFRVSQTINLVIYETFMHQSKYIVGTFYYGILPFFKEK